MSPPGSVGSANPAGPAVVLVAPDKFKGTLGAVDAARRIAAGLRRARPDVVARELPVADGGEGTVAAAVAAGFTRVAARVSGPVGAPVDASFAVRGDVAVVELAEAAGLARLPGGGPAPLTAHSTGVGELIGRALDAGCRRIVLGLGGSACTDGGTGMARALGARFLDAEGRELPPGGGALVRLDRIDTAPLAARLAGADVVVAGDVDNPLLGPAGAAAVYAPQKGASPDDVALLEAGLARLAEVAGRPDAASAPGAGAAGGTGFGAAVFLGARTRPGIALLLDLLGFAELLPAASLVVTGEGSLDAQTLHGKAPAGVAAAARAHSVPVAVVCGTCSLTPDQLTAAHISRVVALDELAGPGRDAFADAAELAEEAGALVAGECLPGEEMR